MGQSGRKVGKSLARTAEGPDGEKVLIEETGYNAKRDEFDPEFDNDAELVLAEMEFKESDSPADREVKLRLIDIYNKRYFWC